VSGFDKELEVVHGVCHTELEGTLGLNVRYEDLPPPWKGGQTPDEWVHVYVVSGEGRKVSIGQWGSGQAQRRRYVGIVRFNIYYPRGKDASRGRKIADLIAPFFQDQNIGGLSFKTAGVRGGPRDVTGKSTLGLVIAFERDEIG